MPVLGFSFREWLDVFTPPEPAPKRIKRMIGTDGTIEEQGLEDYEEDVRETHSGRGWSTRRGNNQQGSVSDLLDGALSMVETRFWNNTCKMIQVIWNLVCRKTPFFARLLGAPFILYFMLTALCAKLPSIGKWLMHLFMASRTLNPNDSLYDAFRMWLSKKTVLQDGSSGYTFSTKYLQQTPNADYPSPSGNAWTSGRSVLPHTTSEAVTNFKFFHHCGRLFVVTTPQSCKTRPYESTGGSLIPCEEPITIWCLGWSPRPVNDLLTAIYVPTNDKWIELWHPVPSHDGMAWNHASTKRPRSVESIILRSGEKEKILRDIDRYCDPEEKTWYEERGIPYRRGYLFHGKPGCGKTSFVHALAGRHNLKICTISLSDPHMNDRVLLDLFSTVEAGWLVLLEDIDSAGLGRENMMANKNKRQSESANEDPGTAANTFNSGFRYNTDGTRHGKSKNKNKDKNKEIGPEEDFDKKTDKEESTVLTLSGLLNAIDGIASPEGHVLIMTTNHPELLDPALIRAGRVNVRVHFMHADKEQTSNMFKHIYEPSAASSLDPAAYVNEIDEMAAEFASRVPEGACFHSQLQDYLVQYKTEPRLAIENVAAWVIEKKGEKFVQE